jgi:hypothetical protein
MPLTAISSGLSHGFHAQRQEICAVELPTGARVRCIVAEIKTARLRELGVVCVGNHGRINVELSRCVERDVACVHMTRAISEPAWCDPESPPVTGNRTDLNTLSFQRFRNPPTSRDAAHRRRKAQDVVIPCCAMQRRSLAGRTCSGFGGAGGRNLFCRLGDQRRQRGRGSPVTATALHGSALSRPVFRALAARRPF